MIRVLAVHHYPNFGGPYNEAVRLDAALRDRGIETTLVVPDEPGTAVAMLEGRVPYARMALGRARAAGSPAGRTSVARSLPADLRRLRALIREVDPDVVRVHGPHNPHGAIAARMEGRAVLWVVSSSLTNVSRPLRAVGAGLVGLLADAVLLNGRGTADSYPGMGRSAGRWHVYYPPVDTARFAPVADRRAARARVGLDPAGPVVGVVANINPMKGIDLAVEVAAGVRATHPRSRVVVVGDTPASQAAYREQVIARMRAIGVEDAIDLVGHRDDVADWMAAFDLLLVPSRAEGTTTVAGEAMACGLPVVAFDVGAIREVVAHERTGFLVPPADTAAAAARVSDLLADHTLRERMGRAGREAAVERFAPTVVAEVQAAATRDALDRARRTRRPRAR